MANTENQELKKRTAGLLCHVTSLAPGLMVTSQPTLTGACSALLLTGRAPSGKGRPPLGDGPLPPLSPSPARGTQCLPSSTAHDR